MKYKLKKKNQHGFTLVEIIVVIVILAVLSATLLPRFLNQTERAVIAEAQSSLGALKRGQNVFSDISGTDAFMGTATPITNAEAVQLGLRQAPNSNEWAYRCQAGAPGVAAIPAGFDINGNPTPAVPAVAAIPAACIATRQNGTAALNGSTVAMDLVTGNYAWTGGYRLSSATDLKRGCSI